MSRPLKHNVESTKKYHSKCLKDDKKRSRLRWSNPQDLKVLAERNQAVTPVGAWVESGLRCQEHPAVLAMLTEELHDEMRREKEESLRRFQDAVRRRVSQQAQIRKRQQLQKSREAAEHESRVVQQTSDAARVLTPRKSLFSPCPQGELAIRSPSTCWVTTQDVDASRADNFHLYPHQVGNVMKQVRHRLAACQSVRDGQEMSELPKGIWKVSPTRDKPVSQVARGGEVAEDEDDHEEEEEEEYEEEEGFSFTGQHDGPLDLQHQGTSQDHRGKTVTFQSVSVCERLLTESCSTGPNPSFKTDPRTSLVLWPREDPGELKRQKQSQFLTYRRLFMDIEREQVQEHQRHKKHLERIVRIKAEKERQRMEEEKKMERLQQQEEEKKEMAERERLILERLRLEEEEMVMELERRERAKKAKETSRYIEALRAQMKERINQERVELPPLCCCGDSFWDSHPDTCANNCPFYNNPKVYAQALQSVLLNCGLKESMGRRSPTRRIPTGHATSPRK